MKGIRKQKAWQWMSTWWEFTAKQEEKVLSECLLWTSGQTAGICLYECLITVVCWETIFDSYMIKKNKFTCLMCCKPNIEQVLMNLKWVRRIRLKFLSILFDLWETEILQIWLCLFWWLPANQLAFFYLDILPLTINFSICFSLSLSSCIVYIVFTFSLQKLILTKVVRMSDYNLQNFKNFQTNTC